MIKIGDNYYRNLEEQVQKNKEDIANHYNIDRVLAEVGIKVIGQLSTPEDLEDKVGIEYGDAYAIGTEPPYDFYIWTRADVDSGHLEDYWFNIGQLAVIGPQGPTGPQGEKGDRGESSTWYYGTTPSNPREGDMLLQSNGNVLRYQKTGAIELSWVQVTNIKGANGLQGVQGPRGLQGPQGEPGPKGETGDVGGFINLYGILTDISQLPNPDTLNNRTIAYLIGTSYPYDLYIQVGDADGPVNWVNSGPLNVSTLVFVNGEAQNTWNADVKADVTYVDNAIANIPKPDLTDYATKEYVNEAVANIDIPEGGSSYTFTDGLTEINGVVRNANYDTMTTSSTQGIILAGKNEKGYNISDMYNVGGNGSLWIGSSYRPSWTSQPSFGGTSKGSITFGRITGLTGRYDYGIYSATQGGLVGGYTYGTAEYGLIQATSCGSVCVGIGETETGIHKVKHDATSALGRGLQSTATDQFLIGRCNSITDMTNMAFIIGNGTDDSTRSNALTVDKSGNVVAAGTVTPTGADYAEYFEFEDGNPDRDDRMGYLVELINGKIRLANGTEILGATSGTKSIIGDAEEMNWHGKYERDEFGRYIYEDVTIVHEAGTETEYTETLHVKKISKDYDPDKTYIPRSQRPEWYPVGLLGKVLVRHDGTLVAGDYVKAVDGVATKADEKTNIRVLEVISDNVIKVLIK